ncbi:hypothetical protein BJ878DRAFT_415581 [Calycina marina]|uniref:WHIM1 domain-containing protein n=1 Tax=Calycina marina TaxID=1763456 RepID=A0A9P7Z846_9HELO|nr:hypothetical protein BJ878DRAFT_415581 [Calycina marina]
MSDSDSSALSSVNSEDERLKDVQLKKSKTGILKFFSKVKPGATPTEPKSPPRPKRESSPEHEYVLADNPDIAFIVMFRARFTAAFPKSLPNFGPQELEREILDVVPGEQAELFLCTILQLLLNRKQDVKPGHYNRALEEAVQSHKSQWAKNWKAKNPLSGGATFANMAPTERARLLISLPLTLTLLRTLVLWSLSSSDAVKSIITASYKQARHEDDQNQPLSVQAWGSDADKRRYFLIEGLDDTHFRVYRESNYTGIKRSWWSVAGSIDELKILAEKLDKEDGGQKARVLGGKMSAAVPRFEATEEKRKRREYRTVRQQKFKRPEINPYMYEGRTRGKRMKYNYSDGEEEDTGYSDATTNRRPTRNTRHHTPEGPTVTLSGRQVKARQGGMYGESMLSGRGNSAAPATYGTSEEPDGSADSRPRRAAAAKAVTGWTAKPKSHIDVYNPVDETDSDDDDASEQDYGDDEEEDEMLPVEEDDDDDVGDISDEDMEATHAEKKSLVVKLSIKKTPTPPRKTTIKLRLSGSPDSKRTQPAGPIEAPPSINGSHGVNPNASPTAVLTNGTNGVLPATTIPVSQPSETAPMSPTLAFRGSPEKPTHFPASLIASGDS